jgi:pimeloyl-ACP methyl ester carboxylesterase
MQRSKVFGSTLAAMAALASATTFAREAPVPHLTWTDCGGGFQCTMATVPLDHDRPRDRTIEIALIRRPAADQAQRIGSLFINPGGPGYSGIEFVRTAPPPAFQLFAKFDLIGFDPRGLGASRPAVVDCGEDPSRRMPIPRPHVIDERAYIAEAINYAKNCRMLNRGILSHLSTANVARDLNLLRAGW